MRGRGSRATRLVTCAKKVTLLDYGAGNVLSLRNALKLIECEIETVETARDIENAEVGVERDGCQKSQLCLGGGVM